MLSKRLYLLFIFILSIPFLVSANEGVWLDATRVIYTEHDKAKAVKVNNNSNKIPYLIRSWVTEINGTEVPNIWVVTPPIYRLDSMNTMQLKLNLISDISLAKDKESVFYLNVLSIPGTQLSLSDNKNLGGKVSLAINTKIKLFYRPNSLSDVNTQTEFKKIKIKRINNRVEIINPTPFYVNFASIKIDGVSYNINKQMINPLSRIYINTKKYPKHASYQVINDFGGFNSEVMVDF